MAGTRSRCSGAASDRCRSADVVQVQSPSCWHASSADGIVRRVDFGLQKAKDELMSTIEALLHRRTDLSTFLVHFTRDTEMPTAAARDNLLNILRTGRLEARNTYGMARDLSIRFPEVAASQRTVCFTETPLEHSWMMCADIESRSIHFTGYGLAFTRSFARRRGVNPVWYLDITRGHNWLTKPVRQLVNDAVRSATPDGESDPDPAALARSPILQLAPFLDQMGHPAVVRKEFWWEREWRHVGDLHFSAKDLVVVFVPESEHKSFRESLAECADYDSVSHKIMDVQWGLERMLATLASVIDHGPFPA